MPTVYHPNAVRDTDDDVDDRVYLGGESVEVSDDGTLDVTDGQADTLARMYDVTVSDLRVGEETDDGPTGGDESGTCTEVKTDGEVCGRDLPCPYHSEDSD